MSIKCPCGTKIFGEKNVGDKFTCYHCRKRFVIVLKKGKLFPVEVEK